MKTDKELRQKMTEMFDDMEAEPQIESWENISNAIRPETKKRFPLWVLCAFFALLLGGISGIFYKLYVLPSANPIASPKSVSTKPAIILAEKCEETPVKILLSPKKEVKNTTFPAAKNKPISPIFPTINENKPAILPEKELISAIKIEKEEIIENKVVKSHSPIYYPKYTEIHKSPIVENPLSNLYEDELSFSSCLPKYPFSNIYVFAPKQKQKKGYFSVNINSLATFQLMQEQANPNYQVGKVNLLPTFDAKRLGISTSLSYQMPIATNSEIRFGINAAFLSQNSTYQIENKHIFYVENLPNNDFIIAKKAVNYTKREHLIFAGAALAYTHSFHLLGQKIKGFAGGEIGGEFRHLKMDYWFNTGLEIPLRHGIDLVSLYKLQINRQIDANDLMKTRLYNVGFGLNYRWK